MEIAGYIATTEAVVKAPLPPIAGEMEDLAAATNRLHELIDVLAKRLDAARSGDSELNAPQDSRGAFGSSELARTAFAQAATVWDACKRIGSITNSLEL